MSGVERIVELFKTYDGVGIAHELSQLRRDGFDPATLSEEQTLYCCYLINASVENFYHTLALDDIISIFEWASRTYPDCETIKGYLAALYIARGDAPKAAAALSAAPGLPQRPVLERRISDIAACSVADFSVPESERLLLLDTAFPSTLSSFRYGEFSTYLERFPNAVLACRPDYRGVFTDDRPGIDKEIGTYLSKHPHARGRLAPFNRGTSKGRAAYTVFLNNAWLFLNDLGVSANRIAFCLYPGGGFAPGDDRSDMMLRSLCDNSKVERIVTTQTVTHDYLVSRKFCSPDRLLHIFGGVTPAAISPLSNDDLTALRAKKTSSTFNVCFVANRYTALGKEKGYDVFVDVVNALAGNADFHFHVVGPFDRSLLPIRDDARITFYGMQFADFFPEFYAGMDVILSPNIPLSMLDSSHKTFDGFPLTTVSEAGLHGAAMFTTDYLGMNRRLDGSEIFRSGVDAEIIGRDAGDIVERLKHYRNNRSALEIMQRNGRDVLLRELGFEAQMTPRIKMLRELCR